MIGKDRKECGGTGESGSPLTEAHSKNSKKKSFRDLVPESLHEFEDIFSKEAFDALPQTCQWDHTIELNTDNPHL